MNGCSGSMAPEAVEWLGLHRVHEGGVTTLDGYYFNCGRPVGGHLVEVLDGLISAGLLSLGRPSESGQQQVCVTQIHGAGSRKPYRPSRQSLMNADSSDLVIAKGLLDELKVAGFEFQRTATGPDGPLLGHRDAGRWVDTLHLRGFSRDCCGWRRRKTSLMVADEVLIERRVDGSALTVLREVLSWEKES